MYRILQIASASPARRFARLTNVVEYGLLTTVLVTMVSTGATLVGDNLSEVYFTVARTLEQAAKPQGGITFGQTTSRKGAPIVRAVSGKFTPIVSSPLF